MITDTPDAWVIIKIQQPEKEAIYKVLAGWYGGYLGSDVWKINSGISKIREDEKYWDCEGFSGSVYRCHKNAERLTNLTHSVLESYAKQLEGRAEITQVKMEDIINLPEFAG